MRALVVQAHGDEVAFPDHALDLER